MPTAFVSNVTAVVSYFYRKSSFVSLIFTEIICGSTFGVTSACHGISVLYCTVSVLLIIMPGHNSERGQNECLPLMLTLAENAILPLCTKMRTHSIDNLLTPSTSSFMHLPLCYFTCSRFLYLCQCHDIYSHSLFVVHQACTSNLTKEGQKIINFTRCAGQLY
jgi:hypothetical protein